MLTLIDEVVLEQLVIYEDVSNEEYLTEVRAIKQKVIRDLLLTIKFGKCPKDYKVDPETKTCVRMSTGEIKLFHKLAKRGAKKFAKKGTGAAMVKLRKRTKSLAMGERLHLYKHAKKN